MIFDASGTMDEGVPCGSRCTYSWSFGDGGTGSGIDGDARIPHDAAPSRAPARGRRPRPVGLASPRPFTVQASTPPTADFSFSPNAAGRQPGHLLHRLGVARDPAAHRSWATTGTSAAAATAAASPSSSTTTSPGAYNVTLTVTDDLLAQQARRCPKPSTVGAPRSDRWHHPVSDLLADRVEADQTSDCSSTQLAEEYRRAGQTEEAVRVSREGLNRHPGYLSARVTLGRALLNLGQLDEARLELQFVATEAPDNLAAIRGLAEIIHRKATRPRRWSTTSARCARPARPGVRGNRPAAVAAGGRRSRPLQRADLRGGASGAAIALPLGWPRRPLRSRRRPLPEGRRRRSISTRWWRRWVRRPLRRWSRASCAARPRPSSSFRTCPATGDDPFAALEAELRAQEAPRRDRRRGGRPSRRIEEARSAACRGTAGGAVGRSDRRRRSTA